MIRALYKLKLWIKELFVLIIGKYFLSPFPHTSKVGNNNNKSVIIGEILKNDKNLFPCFLLYSDCVLRKLQYSFHPKKLKLFSVLTTEQQRWNTEIFTSCQSYECWWVRLQPVCPRVILPCPLWTLGLWSPVPVPPSSVLLGSPDMTDTRPP